VIDGVEELADVHVQYPVHWLALDSYNQGIERVVRTATGTKPVNSRPHGAISFAA
jgi:hypothetical protein